MNDLPIFYATIENEDDGIYAMSLVTAPATEKDWVCFKENEQMQKFAIQDEEKHILCGVGMVADTPIYRRDELGREFYIVYTKEVIRKMAEKFLSDNTIGNVDIQHNGELLPKGIVKLQELFIVDKEKGISPTYVEVPDGSLMVNYKVENDELWELCKNGQLNGFSLAGFFSVRSDNNFNKTNKQNFMSSIKEKLARLLAEYGSVTAENGTVIEYEGDSLEVGVVVNVEDGEYVVEDKIYVVTEGKVAGIKDVEPIEEPETAEEETVEAEETETVEEAPVVEEPTEEIPNEVEVLKAEIDALKSEIEAIKSQIEEIVTKPEAEPVAEAFEKIETVDENRWERFNRIMKK